MEAISATEFKATCLDLLDQVSSGATDGVIITKRGRVVGVLRSVERADESLFGCMRDTAIVAPGFDLTEPVGPEFDAATGLLHR